MKRLGFLPIILASAWAVQAFGQSSAPLDEAAERVRIQQERETLLTWVAQAERDCYQRFAVNDCLADVRSTRRAELASLRRQEVALDDARRRQRAAEQLLRSDEKAAARP
jgi:colicin import membrane protein